MNLKKLFLKLRYRRTAKHVTENPYGEPLRKLCELIFTEISIAQFALYHAGSGFGEHVVVPYHTIDAYTERMKELVKIAKKEGFIQPVDLTLLEKQVSIDAFFISSSGYYQDVPKAVERFRDAVLEFCQLMEKSDDAKYGIMEHNGRVCGRLFVNLIEVGKALTAVSLVH